ncbi:MAG TPA: IS110 family transposase [Gaiellaceae bacterium]|nr:IS110 family transposase [Gaiellaceae bacterium]
MGKCIRFVGLDDSKDRIDVAVAAEGRDGEVRAYGSIPNTPEALKKLVRQLGQPKTLHFVYEAGPCGYGTYRELLALGAHCVVVAPSKTPRRTGDRIKTDRRDAATLARLHRAGELRAVWVLDEATEAMRDLTRAREDAKQAQTKARQRLQSFLLRRGRRYPGRSNWTKSHVKWLSEQRFAHHAQQLCMEEYVKAVEEAGARVERLESAIHELVCGWSLGATAKAMTAHRGVSLVTAATMCAEIGDLTRFDRARDLMGFIGLVPSLHATGQTHRSGAITKTGNGHVRRVLVEAAWAFRHPARRTAVLRARLQDQPEAVQELSWKAQVRLCGRYRRMVARGKHRNKVVTAVARELVGFLWATARVVTPAPSGR